MEGALDFFCQGRGGPLNGAGGGGGESVENLMEGLKPFRTKCF